MSVFKDKVLLITGGTGSFGNAVLRRFLDSDIKEISLYISDKMGGCGCARDIVEQVLRAQAKWMTDAKAFGW